MMTDPFQRRSAPSMIGSKTLILTFLIAAVSGMKEIKSKGC
jgi:hypothetical protein